MDNRFKFKKVGIDALPTPGSGKRATYYDEEIKKLALRISAGGAKTFYVVKRTGSSMAWVKLGTFPEMTVEMARREAARVLGEFAAGSNPAEKRREERQKQTFGEAFVRYMEMHAGPQKVKTAADITAMWQRFLGHLPDEPAKKHGRKRSKHPAGVNWEDRKLDQIDTADVRALHAAIGKTHRTMANRVVELISSIYGRAIEWGYRGANPAAGVRPFKEAKRDRFIQPSELPRFFKALAEDLSDDFKHFVLLALLTGARRENVLFAPIQI